MKPSTHKKSLCLVAVGTLVQTLAFAQPVVVDPLQQLLEKASKAIENSVTGADGSTKLFDRYQERKEGNVLRQLVELAPQKGQAAASNYVGCIYGLGIGVPVDEARAARYFAHASKDYPLATYNYGLVLAKAKKQDLAYRAMDSAWSRAGIEQAGAWLLHMRQDRKLDIQQIAKDLDSIQSPVGQYHEALKLHRAGKHQAAINKLTNPASYGIVGAHGLLATIYLNAHVTSPSKFFDWVTGLSHVYIEMGIKSDKWEVPALMPSSAIGASREHFGAVFPQADEVNREAHARASQWFAARKERPKRYEVYLCKADRVFDRKSHNNLKN